MRKLLLFLTMLFLQIIYTHAQEYVHQVLILNEGYFDYTTQQIIEPVTIGSYDPINQQFFVPQQKGNNETKFSRKKERVAVPSDAYDIDISTLSNRNQQTRNSKNYFKSENNSFTKNIKIKNNQNLSKEEESLLEEIIIEDLD